MRFFYRPPAPCRLECRVGVHRIRSYHLRSPCTVTFYSANKVQIKVCVLHIKCYICSVIIKTYIMSSIRVLSVTHPQTRITFNEWANKHNVSVLHMEPVTRCNDTVFHYRPYKKKEPIMSRLLNIFN